MGKFLTVFLLFNLILSVFYIDLWENANTTSRVLPIISFFETGSLRIDRYHELTCDKAYIDGHYYTDKAPLPSLFVIPFFGILKNVGIIEPSGTGSFYGKHIYALGGILVGSIPFIMILGLSLTAIRSSIIISPPLLAMLSFYSSFIFVFTGTFFAHIFSGLLLLLSYIFIRNEKIVLSGLFAGLAFLSEYNLAVIYLVWGLLMIFRRKYATIIRFMIGVFPSIIFILIYNYIFTGNPFTMLYKFHTFDQLHQNYGFSFPGFQSLWGLSFSWYKGLFFYAPILLLVLFVVVINFRKVGSKKFWNNYLVLPVIIYFLFIASYFGWWGGWTHGPRLLLAPAVLLIYGGIKILVRLDFNKGAFWFLVMAGLVINFAAKATLVYSVPTGEKNPLFDLLLPRLLNGELNSNNLLSIYLHISPQLAFGIFISLFLLSLIVFNPLYKKWVSR